MHVQNTWFCALQPQRRVAGTVSWYLVDGLGSVLAEVSPSGTITSSRNYDVYGNVRSGVNANGTSAHKFVGNLGHTIEKRITGVGAGY